MPRYVIGLTNYICIVFLLTSIITLPKIVEVSKKIVNLYIKLYCADNLPPHVNNSLYPTY